MTILSVLAALGVFVLSGMVFHVNVIFSAVLAAVSYFGFSLLFTKKDAKEEKQTSDAQPDSDETILRNAEEDVETMKAMAPRITKESVRSEVNALIGSGEKILQYLHEHPEKIDMSRKFANYYLDMAGKFTEKYVQFQDTGLHTAEITDTMNQAEHALASLNKAFNVQYTRLLSGELMDVEADVKVLEQMVRMEGDMNEKAQ